MQHGVWNSTPGSLAEPFSRPIANNRFRVRLSKCLIMQQKLESLGQVMDKTLVHIDDNKSQKTRDAQPPRVLKDLK